MRIALIQQSASNDRSANVERGLAAATRAADEGAQVICFAELAFDRFLPQFPVDSPPLELAESVPGQTTERFAELARQREVVVILNLYERDGEMAFDCSPVIGTDGQLLGRTRMVHITDYDFFHERGYYTPGDCGAPVYATPFGRIGVAICYDRHFPEYMRALALAGAEVVFVPQAGAVDEWPEGLYEAELQVAAFQNGYFTALCNRVGKEDRVHFAGESFVCDPSGRVIARLDRGVDDILMCDLDLKTIEDAIAHKLFLTDRRPELYADWVG